MNTFLLLMAAPILLAARVPEVAFTLDWVTVAQLIASTVLPLIVGLVTKLVTNSNVRALLLLLLSLIASLLAEAIRAWQQSEVYDIGAGLLLALPTFLIGVGMHYGFWKPTGAAEKVQAIGFHQHDSV